MEATGLDLRRLFHEAWQERRRVVAIVLVSMAVTLGIVFLVPRWYRATAVILPPEESDLLSSISMAQRALSKFPAFGVLPDFYTPADIYKAVLESRSAKEELIRTYDLRTVYRQKSLEKTIKLLKSHYKVRLNSDGTIKLELEDRDPRRAADMANTLLAILDRMNVEKRNTQARRTRLFLEHRLAETDSLLRASEAALRLYQEEHHAVIPTSVGGDVKAAGELMARQSMLEIRLGLMRGYLREDDEHVIQAQAELGQLRQQIGRLPRLENDLLRLARDEKVQEQLFFLLSAELEQARIRETLDTPTVQVLDPARPPERHCRPRRLIITAAMGVLVTLGCLVWLALRQKRGPGA